jgi:tetratricopeptide (TPR) repeat protein
MVAVPVLADSVLPLIRTRRTDLYRWNVSNEHGSRMHEAVDALEEAAATATDAAEVREVYSVTHKALAAAIKVITRADDSSGIIGDACRRLLALYPQLAARAGVPVGQLVEWMIKFQFNGEVDYFELDPVAYAPALGDKGMGAYRARLDEIRARLGSEPNECWSSPYSHEWFVLQWNAQRLAVLDCDIDAIIRTHAKDRKVAAWFEDTARALEEIGEIDLAIDWAKHATDFDSGHQSLKAARYWCELLDEHRPTELVDARVEVFRRWPSLSTAAAVYQDVGDAWPTYRDTVLTTLSRSPRDAVLFVLGHLDNVRQAWELAHTLHLDCAEAWEQLAKAYQKIDPAAVLPVYRRLVENELAATGARHYQVAARRLKTMRRLAATDNDSAVEVDTFVAGLREQHRRRPRLQLEFDRAGLP